jgi:hypothetical protein
MSLGRPLVRFENFGRAQLINNSSMPRKTRSKSKKGKSGSNKKPRIVKGRIHLKVAGYSGIQKLAPSSLVPYLPINKLRIAAKKALGASGKSKKKTVKRRRKQK